MAVEEIRAVLNALVDDVHVLLVEGRDPDAVLVREPHFEIARAARAVPNVMFVLPVLAKDGGKVLLRLLNPDRRREERPLAFTNVLRNEKVKTRHDEIPIFALRRAFIPSPERGVCVKTAGLESERKVEIEFILVLAPDGVRLSGGRVKRNVEILGGAVV